MEDKNLGEGKNEGISIDMFSPSHIQKERRMRGMKLRDEYLCPITQELMREPVILLDGHSYEKNAIEKWFKVHNTSPRSGQIIEKMVIPNINMKKLIQDLINEGGAGLYQSDKIDQTREILVCPEKVLVLKCLGPPDSDWYMQSFQVTRSGCVGGRRVQQEEGEDYRELMTFKDVAISRKHFEISFSFPRKYCIRDLGSAGGTFVRIPSGQMKELHPGMMLLIGKHQFTVSSIDDCSDCSEESSDITPSDITSLVLDAEQLVADLTASSPVGENIELKRRLDSITSRLIARSNRASSSSSSLSSSSKLLQREKERVDNGMKSEDGKLNKNNNNNNNNNNSNNNNTKIKSSKKCTLTCFYPDGSPFQGKSFVVGPEGASIGRHPSNDIALYADVSLEGQTSKVVNLDSAVSSEHARIIYNVESMSFLIADGVLSKPSTNGTWFRLSGPHQESPYYQIQPGLEFIVGTIRFEVKESMTILEKTVDVNLDADSK